MENRQLSISLQQLNQLAAFVPDMPAERFAPLVAFLAKEIGKSTSSGGAAPAPENQAPSGSEIPSLKVGNIRIAAPDVMLGSKDVLKSSGAIAPYPSPEVEPDRDHRGSPYSDEDLATIERMHQSGEGPNAIARQLGRDRAAVANKIQKMISSGVLKRNQEKARLDEWTAEEDARLSDLRAEGLSLTEMSEAMGRSYEAVRSRLKQIRAVAPETVTPFGVTWSDEENATLARLIDEGKSYAEIAEALGRTKKAVSLRGGKLKRGEIIRPTPTTASEPEKETAASVVGRPTMDAVPVVAEQVQQSVGQTQQKPSPIPAVEPAHLPALTSLQRRLVEHLKTLDEDFMPVDDLYLVQKILEGVPVAQIADELACEGKDVLKRWREMLVPEIQTPKGQITISGRTDLLTALEWVAALDEAASAIA